jgi:lysophospholipase L1-like esterase
MRIRTRPMLFRSAVLSLVALAVIIGCSRSQDETIAGVTVPVPKAMTRTAEKPVEMSLLGFGAGQATFYGDLDTEKIVEFYKKEMPARGWQSNMNLRSGGAMLAYSKEGKTLLIGVGQQDGKTNLTLTVGGMAH